MEKEARFYERINARIAGWISSSPPSLIGYQLRCGVSLPEKEERPHGKGKDWQPRTVAALVRECYGRGLRIPQREEVERAALCLLPEPEEDEESRLPHKLAQGLSPHARWALAVEEVSEAAHRVLSHGPASGEAGGEVLFSGGMLEARVLDLPVEQWVDLLWRRPDGVLEAVLILLEDDTPKDPTARGGTAASLGTSPGIALSSDWRCILAAAIVAELYGETPDLHLVLVEQSLARLGRVSWEVVVERLSGLGRALDEALQSERFVEAPDTGEGAIYPFDPDMLQPSGNWRGPVRRPPFGHRPPLDWQKKK